MHIKRFKKKISNLIQIIHCVTVSLSSSLTHCFSFYNTQCKQRTIIMMQILKTNLLHQTLVVGLSLLLSKVQFHSSHFHEFEIALNLFNCFFVCLFYKECHERRSRSEALLKKLDCQRPITLDLNNATAATAKLSLQLASMKIASVISSHTSGGGCGGSANH